MKKLSWLDFTTIENRIRGLFKIINHKLPSAYIHIYSLSDNTLSDLWAFYDNDGGFYETYSKCDLLLKAKVQFLFSRYFDCRLNLELVQNGDLHFEVYFKSMQEFKHNEYTEVLSRFANQKVVCCQSHKELYDAILILIDILQITLNEKKPRFEQEKIFNFCKYFGVIDKPFLKEDI